MSTTLRFRQHESFQRAAWHMAGAGALAGLVAHAAFHGTQSPWALGLVAGATILGALSPALRSHVSELAVRIGLTALGAAGLVLLTRNGEPTSAIAVFALLFGAAMGWGLKGYKLAAVTVAGALVAVLAREVFLSVAAAQVLASVPDWLVTTGASTAFSFVSVFALAARHMDLERDQVAATYAELSGSLDGEVRDLVDQSYALWTKASVGLSTGDANREILQEGVLRLFHVARRWRAVEGASAETKGASLVERMGALQDRIDKTEDEVTRTQYEQAKAALAEQLRYIKAIDVSRERVLARMHNYLAAMERLRMAIINLESTHASRDAVDVQPLVSNLQEIGADMDSCSAALAEADRLAAA